MVVANYIRCLRMVLATPQHCIGFHFQVGLRANSSPSWGCKEEVFWAGVTPSTVLGLQEDWAYGPDFLLFQYTARQYFRQIRQMCQQEKEEEGTHKEIMRAGGKGRR